MCLTIALPLPKQTRAVADGKRDDNMKNYDSGRLLFSVEGAKFWSKQYLRALRE